MVDFEQLSSGWVGLKWVNLIALLSLILIFYLFYRIDQRSSVVLQHIFNAMSYWTCNVANILLEEVLHRQKIDRKLAKYFNSHTKKNFNVI